MRRREFVTLIASCAKLIVTWRSVGNGITAIDDDEMIQELLGELRLS